MKSLPHMVKPCIERMFAFAGALSLLWSNASARAYELKRNPMMRRAVYRLISRLYHRPFICNLATINTWGSIVYTPFCLAVN
ncbi:hypothetical protein CEXT_136951 [Caerostris extrusa]|uniref:Secreted protein n=1 Tax=Caerostris extrusa TaxID=172846 RepID=A0AAV4U7M5_CAEEX|nr:hypothetical protein CEXT_136951 [Caerostris extrusa]